MFESKGTLNEGGALPLGGGQSQRPTPVSASGSQVSYTYINEYHGISFFSKRMHNFASFIFIYIKNMQMELM